MSEAVLNDQIKLRRTKNAVEDIFQLYAINVVQLVRNNHLYSGQ